MYPATGKRKSMPPHRCLLPHRAPICSVPLKEWAWPWAAPLPKIGHGPRSTAPLSDAARACPALAEGESADASRDGELDAQLTLVALSFR